MRHWRSALAGAGVALSALLALCLLGLAIGLGAFNAATAAQEGVLPNGLGRNAGLWFAFSMLLAFTAGGYVSAQVDRARDASYAAWHGLPVFLLASPFLLLLLLGSLVTAAMALAGAIGELHLDPNVAARANPIAIGSMAGHLRDLAWAVLGGCILGLAGSAFGGMLGSPMARRGRFRR